MLIFIGRRVAAAVLVILVVSFIIFCCLYLAPGGPEQAILGPTAATPAALAAIRRQFGLDKPFPVQYLHFLQGVVTLNFGRSYQTGELVGSGIVQRLAVTLPLALGGFVLSVVLGLAGGVVSAYHRGRPVDRILGAVSIGTASVPVYATAILLIFVFGVELQWFPISGGGTGPADTAWHSVLPVVSLGLVGAATMLRRTRIAVVAALARDDIAFARARGLSERDVLVHYVARHAGVTLLTAASVVLIFMVAGTAVAETAFAMDGVGSYLITAINGKDIPTVQGIATVITIFVVVINLVTDVLYAVVDPRIKKGVIAA